MRFPPSLDFGHFLFDVLEACCKQTIGLLQRRHIEIDHITYIGKESNRLEDVESGMIQDEDEVYTEYIDPSRDEWTTKILPALQAPELSEIERLIPEMSRRALIDLRAERSSPHPRNLKKITAALARTKA